MVTVLSVLAATWGVIMAVAPALQIRRVLARRSSDDVSLGYFAVLLPGFALWIGYGSVKGEWALVIPNSVAFAIAATTIGVALYLRRTSRPTEPPEADASPSSTSRTD